MAKIFDLYYGEPGAAKTRSIIELICHVHKTTGKLVRVYIGDGSLQMYENSGLVDDGIVIPMSFIHRDYPFSVCQQMCEGMWPLSDAKDAKFRMLTKDEVEKTGLWIFEGASVMGNYMLGDAKGGLAQRAADGEGGLGQDANIRFLDKDVKDKDDKVMQFGGNAPSHYGIAQRHLLQNILRTKQFPGMVVWTAHERYDDGERGGGVAKNSTVEKYKMGDKIIGPELAGKALTSSISREFGNTLHFTVAGKKVQSGTDPATGKTIYEDKKEYRIYTSDHFDPDGIVPMKYRAVVRAMNPKLIKDYYVSTEDNPGEGLLQLYQDLKGANKK